MITGPSETVAVADLLRRAVDEGASDLHLKAGVPPVLRVHGRLVPQDMPELTAAAIEAAFEQLTSPDQRREFQDRKELDFAHAAEDVGRFRVNASLQRGSIALSFRLIPALVPTLEDLGLPEVCRSLTQKQRGLVLITGPTGSGKSTTLAAMIDRMNREQRRHVVTIEDPIEFVHASGQCLISQRELGADTTSFAVALKHALRQDPDVILVGEMRDLETVAAAITAAETGHLVLATLHTPSAAQTIDRVIDSFPPHHQQQIRVQLSTVIEAVLCQSLLPRADAPGRVAAVEVLIATPAVRNLIREGKTHQLPNVIQTGAQHGMRSMDQALTALSREGRITPEDAMAHCANPEEAARALGR